MAEKERDKGRKIVLATGSPQAVAQRVADYLGVFAEVIAAVPDVNVIGETKAAILQKRFGNFTYIGNSVQDIPVWDKAGHIVMANADCKLIDKVKRMHRSKLCQVYLNCQAA